MRSVVTGFSLLFISPFVVAEQADYSLADFAADQATRSFVSLDYYRASDGSDYRSLSLDYALNLDSRLSLGIGQSRAPEGAVNSRNIDARNINSWNTGFFSYFGDSFNYALDYEHWSAQGDAVSDTFSFSAGYDGLDWGMYITPELRYIDLYSRRLANGSRRLFEVKGTGLTAGLSYYGWAGWTLSASASSYSYDRDISVINRVLVQRFLSSDALALAYSFLNSKASVELGYDFSGDFSGTRLGFEMNQAVVEGDNSLIRGEVMKLGLYQFDPVLLDLEAGRYRYSEQSVNYTRLSLTFAW